MKNYYGLSKGIKFSKKTRLKLYAIFRGSVRDAMGSLQDQSTVWGTMVSDRQNTRRLSQKIQDTGLSCSNA